MNEILTALFEGRVEPGVYRLISRAAVATLRGEAAQHSWRFAHLEGRNITGKADFLRASAAALTFPAYSGRNWDALEENLRDLSWMPAGRGTLVLYDHAGVFAAAHPTDFAVALAILRSAIASWREAGAPMAVLLRGAGRAAAGVPRLGPPV
jgi:hypothetical protein